MNDYNYVPVDNGIANRYFFNGNMIDYGKNDGNGIVNYIPGFSDSNIKMMANGQILEPYMGFLKGNLFANLYDGYRNYMPSDVNPSNEREALLAQWQQYNFALVDLNLYLDVVSDDQYALELFNKYLGIRQEIGENYEKKFGPLTLDDYVGYNSWTWVRSPWPWEVIK